MKTILLSLALLATASLLAFCKHQPKFTAEHLPPQQVHWGTGGGIVGKERSHALLRNGQLFLQDVSGAWKEAGKTKAKTAAAIFKSVETLDYARLESQHPANIYSFLEWQDGDAMHRIVWGDPKFPVDPAVKTIFDRLNGLLKQ